MRFRNYASSFHCALRPRYTVCNLPSLKCWFTFGPMPLRSLNPPRPRTSTFFHFAPLRPRTFVPLCLRAYVLTHLRAYKLMCPRAHASTLLCAYAPLPYVALPLCVYAPMRIYAHVLLSAYFSLAEMSLCFCVWHVFRSTKSRSI